MGNQEFEALIMISVVFLTVGIVFAIVPIFMISARKKRAQKCDRSTTAEVVEYVRYHGDSHYTYAPVYAYWANGAVYKTVSKNAFTGRRFSVGDKFTIFYNNENPKMIYVQAEQFIIKFITTIFFIISIAMLLVGIIVGAQIFL